MTKESKFLTKSSIGAICQHYILFDQKYLDIKTNEYTWNSKQISAVCNAITFVVCYPKNETWMVEVAGA